MNQPNPLTILIVDDRQDDVELMTTVLEMAMPHCCIAVARSAEQALDKVREESWSLILLDYKLPRQSGLELLPQLLRVVPTAAVIMLTGHGDERIAVEAMRRGAAYYLKKSPALVTELPLVVTAVLDKWRMRQDLDLAHSRLQSLIHHINDIIYELDADGHLTFISREVEWSLGYSPSELIGAHYSQFLDPADAARFGRLFAERRTGSRAVRGLEVSVASKRGQDVHLQTRGGELRLFEVNAAGLYDLQRRFLGTAGVARDITKRKQDEAARREFETRLQTVLDLASDAIFLKSLDGRYLVANPAAQRMLAGQDTQVLGKTDTELLDAATAEEFMRTDRQVLASSEKVECMEKAYRPDGSIQFWHTVKTPHLNANGQLAGLFGISRDVTQQLQREEDAHHADKLKALGQVVAGVAHELNNPLTTILGHAELLRQRTHTDPDCHATVCIIADQAERTAAIVRDLQTFGQPQAPTRTRVWLNDLLAHEIRSHGEDFIAHAVTVSQDLDPALPPLVGDPGQLRQVFSNLLRNASQAMGAAVGERRVTVSTRLVSEARQGEGPDTGTRGGRSLAHAASPTPPVVALPTEGAWVEVRVTDTGPGVPEPLRHQIFTPFFTTKPVGEGAGLGLAIVHSLVTEHGGTITVDEAPGGGAQFTVRLPIGEGAAEEPATPVAVSAVPGRSRVLILEDEPLIRDMMSKALRRADHEVVVFGQGAQALAHLEQARQTVDLILTDVKMSGMSGKEFFTRLTALDPAWARRVIFCTGDTMEAQTARLIEASGNPFLAKPFTPRKLLAVMQDVLRRLGAGGG